MTNQSPAPLAAETSLEKVTSQQRAALLAKVYAIILSPEWGAPDEPVQAAGRRRRPAKRRRPQGE